MALPTNDASTRRAFIEQAATMPSSVVKASTRKPDGVGVVEVEELPGRLRSVLAAVRARASKARIVLVGYLPVIPATGPGVCEAVPLSPADAARMRSVAVRLAQVIGGVAATTGTQVVRSSLIGHGHDACSTTSFVAGAHPGRNPGWPSPVTARTLTRATCV